MEQVIALKEMCSLWLREWWTPPGSCRFNLIPPTGWRPASRGTTVGKSFQDSQKTHRPLYHLEVLAPVLNFTANHLRVFCRRGCGGIRLFCKKRVPPHFPRPFPRGPCGLLGALSRGFLCIRPPLFTERTGSVARAKSPGTAKESEDKQSCR
jgi:hypothetical protein